MSLKRGKEKIYEESGLSRFGRLSIAARLMTLYTLSALIILCVTNSLLYWQLVKNLELKNDFYIRDEINVLQAMLRGPNSEKEFAREIELEHAERKNIKHFVRVLDDQGHILMENPQMETIIPPVAFPPPTQDYVTYSERIKFRAENGNVYVLKALRTDISGFGGKGKVLQIAMDVSDLYLFLADYRIKLVSMLVLGVLASALAGKILSRRGLRPLTMITQTAQHITASHLNERIDPKRWPKELYLLAVAFDSMLDRLETSIEELSHYSANLAHELRTPINNLMVEADIALSRPRTADEYRKVMGSNMEEYVRLSRMIDSLLFLARTEKAQAGLNLALMDVRKEIEDIAEFYSAVASDEGVKVACTGEAALYADPVLFRRAVSNILANAINYTPMEGEISLFARQSDCRSVEVTVSDNGCGIAQEHLPRIFDRFYRVPSARMPEAQGSGLGLAIVKSIMELHGGAVEIQSELTRGTAVTMRFPSSKPVDP
jgi:two-component system heavy metal sensor histidine kinase CusS